MIFKSLTILLTRIYLVLINFLTSIIIARGLGPANKGILATILLLVSIFSLFYRFGTDVSIIYHIKMRNGSIARSLYVVLTSDGEILDTSCHMLETANFRDYIS